MTTYAVYLQTDNGIARVGTFKGPRGSVRKISAALRRKMPNLPQEGVFIASRWLINGQWADGERLPADFS